jgi:hypothetical protein
MDLADHANCHYIVLSHHSRETSKGGQLLVLLVEYVEEEGSRQRRKFLAF